jgi:hypothetical protein
MNTYNNIPRLLGAAFLFVLVASITASALSVLTLLSGSISDSFVNISNKLKEGLRRKLINKCLSLLLSK